MSEMETSTVGENKPPKPSGIRPPSKIGRLCSSGTPKPAVPVPSKNDTTLETMRKISDDYSRKQLADVQEADEESDTFQDNFGSCSNASRERKPSNHSIVLTEDTDGFIIGDKVYVGGSKSGQIAYIGETQFAPGEWAGVVLDEPIGKNDGSVAGVRYFQCEPKKGVFSRLTRLTREALSLPSPSPASPASERGSIISDRPPVPNGKAKSPGSVTSSIPRARRSSSPNGSIRSYSSRISTSTATAGELRLGERVIVSSSQGSKAGTLRFMGPTDFAVGQWCGVELDDPIGKNDGSVEGKRYFECAPRFGLFAPLAKVSRSPSNRRPGTCAVHGRGSPPDSLASSMMSQTGSIRPRLGVTSLGTGNQRLSGPRAVSTPMSAKNTLQELLREKQKHIELLMNELDIEKSELAKTTMKIDNTQAEMEVMKSEMSKNLDELSKLKVERDAVMRQLEDEKQKVDDLMFRAEEDNIHKEDFTKLKEELLESKEKQSVIINNLETELLKIKSQLEEVHMQNDLLTSQHKAESDVLISQHKDELQAGQDLASQLQNLLDEAHTLLREKVAEREVFDKSHFDEMSKLKLESERSINDLKTKLSETQTELSTYISSSNEKLNEAECKISSLNEKLEKNTIESNGLIRDLRSQLEQKQVMLDVKAQESNEVIATSKELELNYKKELEKLKMQNSSINLDLEAALESKKGLESELDKIKSELNNFKSILLSKETEFNSALSSESQERDTLLTEMEKLKEQLSIKQSNIDKLTKDTTKESAELRKQIEEHVSELNKNQDEIATFKESIKTLENEVSQSKILKEEYEKLIKEKDIDLETKTKSWIDEKAKLTDEFDKQNITLTSEISKRADEVKNLSQQIVEQQQKVEDVSKQYSDVNANYVSVQSNNIDLERQLKIQKERNGELQSFKELLEKQINDITNNSMSSNEQLSVTSNKLIEAENSLQGLKEAMREKNDEYQKMVLDHDEFKNQTNNEINTMTERLKALDKEKVLFEDEIKNLKVQLDIERENINKNNTELIEIKKVFETEKSELMNSFDNEVTAKNKFKDALELSEKNIKELNSRIETLENNANISENALKQKVDELSVSQNDLIKQLEESHDKAKNLESMYNKLVKENDESKESYKSSLHAKEEKEKHLCDEMAKLQDSYQIVQNNLVDKEVLIKDLLHRMSELEFEYKSNIEIALEKDRQIDVSKVEIKKALEEKHNLEKQLNSNISECEMLQQKNVKLNEDVIEKDNLITKQKSDSNEIKAKIISFLSTIKTDPDGYLNDMNRCDLDVFKVCELLDESFSFKEKCNVLNGELESVKGTHVEELKKMQFTNEELSKKIIESEQLVNKLKLTNEQSQEMKQLIEASEADAKKMALLNEAEKNKYEELHKQLLNDIETLKKAMKSESDAFKAQTDALKAQLVDKNKECEDIVLNKKGLLLSLEASNRSSDVLKNKVVELESALDHTQKEDHNENQKLLTEMKNMKEGYGKEINILKSDIAALNEKVSKKRRDVESYKKQYLSSNSDLEKYQLLNDQMKQEIIALNNKLKEFENNNDIIKSNKIPTVDLTQKSNIDTKRLIEEKEEVEGQVSFLNSVIIDMQRKNEELKARVEILEMGVTPQEAEEFNYSGLKQKKITPRMFCDICDKFDAHETEDCPRQTNDDIEVSPSDKKKVPEPRPYCELCEVFGHSTENCDEEETY